VGPSSIALLFFVFLFFSPESTTPSTVLYCFVSSIVAIFIIIMLTSTTSLFLRKSFARAIITSGYPPSSKSSLIRHASRNTQQSSARNFSAFPAPKLFDYDTIVKNLTVADAIESVEEAFGALAKGQVDVPMPMHIGIEESSEAGPGDCHIKGGYVFGAKTFTVKLACVSFYKNLERGLPPGSGVFVVVDAVTGAPLAICQENRAMTDLRTGAAGAVAVKYTTPLEGNTIGFIGCGAIARNMVRDSYFDYHRTTHMQEVEEDSRTEFLRSNFSRPCRSFLLCFHRPNFHRHQPDTALVWVAVYSGKSRGGRSS
jgi:hypothetical protein